MSNNNKSCFFCESEIKDIDYKDTFLLRRFVNSNMKILPKRITGVCSWHQRKLSHSIKRSRIMALLPFTNDKA